MARQRQTRIPPSRMFNPGGASGLVMRPCIRCSLSIGMLTRKDAPPLAAMYIIEMNLQTKFHEDRTLNVASRVLTRFYYTGFFSFFEKCPAPWKPFYSSKHNYFLTHHLIETNLLTKFHENWTILMWPLEKNALPLFHDERKINVTSRKTHVLTKFHEHWTKNVTSRGEKTALPPGGHVFLPIWTIFELVRDINKTSVLTKFHDDWAKIVTSRVFTLPYKEYCPFPWRPYWASNVTSTVFTSFELSRGINGTNVLTKFPENQTINVASRVFTRQNVDDAGRATHEGQKAITKAHHEHVVLR
ncbi:hypothetical protein DPMN_033941 [Dreissena polymorpha]|uniref:Uncharacterized protein n=1 Tax=Dreissena polymorpha TaxID=45954 RepID=A0A9D4RJA2_DREPO|nr:hypothetical protein DPMN_033941 [Dreissena polymorpha]